MRHHAGMRVLLLFLALAGLLTSCGGQEGEFDTGSAPEGDADADADADGDADGDADSDADGDSDADTDADTDVDPRDGGWTGTWSVAASDAGTGTSDTCAGGLSFTVEVAGEPDVQGAAHCDFAGTFAAEFPAGLDVVVVGELAAEPDASGTLAVGTDTWTWTGTFGDSTFDATITGTLAGGSGTLDVAGSAAAGR